MLVWVSEHSRKPASAETCNTVAHGVHRVQGTKESIGAVYDLESLIVAAPVNASALASSRSGRVLAHQGTAGKHREVRIHRTHLVVSPSQTDPHLNSRHGRLDGGEQFLYPVHVPGKPPQTQTTVGLLHCKNDLCSAACITNSLVKRAA